MFSDGFFTFGYCLADLKAVRKGNKMPFFNLAAYSSPLIFKKSTLSCHVHRTDGLGHPQTDPSQIGNQSFWRPANATQ